MDEQRPTSPAGQSSGGYLMYDDLASWWPLLSPPEDYEEEAAFLAALLQSADRPVREVLELGSGGGNTASHLKGQVAMTLVDLSPGMLEVSRALNPECDHVLGDMREVRLGRGFDAVLVHDAVEYMTTEEDLARVMATAFAHCRAGGVAVLVPDHVRETFAPGADIGGSDDDASGRGARLAEWTTDPDPSDGTVRTDYVYLLRGPDGSVHVRHETHVTGLFDRDVWLRLLAAAGFSAEVVTETTTEDRVPRQVFVGRRAG